MIKETNLNLVNNEYAHIRCSCHSPYHFIEIDYEADDGLTYISLVTSPPHFLQRLKNALAYIFKGENSLVLGDIILTDGQRRSFAHYMTNIKVVKL